MTGFAKRVLYTTARVFNTAEGWTVCFHSGLFIKPVWCPRVLRWPSNGPIFPRQADSWLWFTKRLADEFVHGFSCFVWHVEVKMAPMEVIWLFFSKDVSFLHYTSWLPAHPPPCRSASGIGYTSKNYLKWWGKPASYPVYSRYNELLWIAIDLWRNTCRQL